MAQRELIFVNKDTSSYVDAFRELIERGCHTFCFDKLNDQSLEFYKVVKPLIEEKNIQLYFKDIHSSVHQSCNIRPLPQNIIVCVHFIFCDDERKVSEALLDYIDIESGTIVAPIISIHSSFTPLFLISVPKAGTHLLYELANLLGYSPAIKCPEIPEGKNWFCVQGTNSHTEARDFLIESSKHHYFANRNHPFTYSPALFIYRHPLDILVSEANYYHKEGKTAFSMYLNQLTYEERLEKLADDPYLLGTIRDRVLAFAAWLEFSNVIPISFEELIGEKGGGNRKVQEDLIWSLLLKLHVSGCPSTLKKSLFSKDSDTFFKGQIGSFNENLTDKVKKIIDHLPTDFLSVFGYKSYADANKNDVFSDRINEFRTRPLVTGRKLFNDLPICVIHNKSGHNIIRLRDHFYAVPVNDGDLDLGSLSNIELSKLLNNSDIELLKTQIE